MLTDVFFLNFPTPVEIVDGVFSDNFVAYFDGFFCIPQSDTYTFYATAIDIAEFVVNGGS